MIVDANLEERDPALLKAQGERDYDASVLIDKDFDNLNRIDCWGVKALKPRRFSQDLGSRESLWSSNFEFGASV